MKKPAEKLPKRVRDEIHKTIDDLADGKCEGMYVLSKTKKDGSGLVTYSISCVRNLNTYDMVQVFLEAGKLGAEDLIKYLLQ